MQPRISYVDPATIKDQAMLDELDRCRREGPPRPESQAIRAHVPAAFWSFANTWRDVFHRGVVDHNIKELCRVYVSHSVLCEFCGNQRSMKSAKAGLIEDDYGDLSNVELSTRYDDKQKAALGYFIAITMGQQRWLRTLNIEHHQILAETDASMAPGFETLDALAKSKSDPNYWAKKNAKPNSSAA
jgi:alkylhydroperoxidase family enzyme